ncbi:MAG: phage baseplate assembly protein V [Roseiarcus sp.]
MSLIDRVEALEYHIADLKRRQSNFIRPGVVISYDPTADAIVANIGTADAPVPTHPVQVFTHAGAGKSWRPMKAGQQVTLLCPDGDLANAVALPGGFHDKNPAPSSSATEDIEAQRGTARLRTTDTAAFLECGASSVEVQDGTITLTAATIVLASSNIKLGGASASKPLAMLGTLDTGGNEDITNLSSVAFTQ